MRLGGSAWRSLQHSLVRWLPAAQPPPQCGDLVRGLAPALVEWLRASATPEVLCGGARVCATPRVQNLLQVRAAWRRRRVAAWRHMLCCSPLLLVLLLAPCRPHPRPLSAPPLSTCVPARAGAPPPRVAAQRLHLPAVHVCGGRRQGARRRPCHAGRHPRRQPGGVRQAAAGRHARRLRHLRHAVRCVCALQPRVHAHCRICSTHSPQH